MHLNWSPLWLSLRVAALSTLISLVFGLWFAYLLATRRFRGKEVLDAVAALPLVLPPTVLGYYFLATLAQGTALGRFYESVTGRPLVFTWQAAVLASTVYAFPLFVRTARGAFEGLDPGLAKAARSLGASDWGVFWRVTLPLAYRSVLAATALAFARSMGEFGATLMIAGNLPGKTQTAAVAVFEATESGNTAPALALALAISVLAFAAVYVANRLEYRRSQS
ncbi:MAG TPA: molybdate ABC transporter permease subunit [Bryobacteraceae bacterium]|nr:molybdate ABC transporter permease subunit [Bryobacteraceae bacterium]